MSKDKLWAEGLKLLREGDKLWDESNKRRAAGRKLWAEGYASTREKHENPAGLATLRGKLLAEGNEKEA